MNKLSEKRKVASVSCQCTDIMLPGRFQNNWTSYAAEEKENRKPLQMTIPRNNLHVIKIFMSDTLPKEYCCLKLEYKRGITYSVQGLYPVKCCNSQITTRLSNIYNTNSLPSKHRSETSLLLWPGICEIGGRRNSVIEFSCQNFGCENCERRSAAGKNVEKSFSEVGSATGLVDVDSVLDQECYCVVAATLVMFVMNLISLGAYEKLLQLVQNSRYKRSLIIASEINFNNIRMLQSNKSSPVVHNIKAVKDINVSTIIFSLNITSLEVSVRQIFIAVYKVLLLGKYPRRSSSVVISARPKKVPQMKCLNPRHMNSSPASSNSPLKVIYRPHSAAQDRQNCSSSPEDIAEIASKCVSSVSVSLVSNGKYCLLPHAINWASDNSSSDRCSSSPIAPGNDRPMLSELEEEEESVLQSSAGQSNGSTNVRRCCRSAAADFSGLRQPSYDNYRKQSHVQIKTSTDATQRKEKGEELCLERQINRGFFPLDMKSEGKRSMVGGGTHGNWKGLFHLKRLMWFLLIILFSVPQEAQGIRVKEIEMPRYLVIGQRATLRCIYELQNDLLYSVTWWKDGKMFYHYIPSNEKPAVVFTVAGITVNPQKSTLNEVELVDVRKDSSGLYKCEVVAEAPTFTTSDKTANMTVLDTSALQPVVKGVKPLYRVGDLIRLNCSAPQAPATHELQWETGGREIHEEHVQLITSAGPKDLHQRDSQYSTLPIVEPGQGGPNGTSAPGNVLTYSPQKASNKVLMLSLHARKPLFPDGSLKITCTNKVHEYQQSFDVVLHLDNMNYTQPVDMPTQQQTGGVASLQPTSTIFALLSLPTIVLAISIQRYIVTSAL